MTNPFVDNINEAGQTAYDAVKEVFALNQSVFTDLVEKQLQVVNQLVELGVKQAKLVAETKDQRALVQGQISLAEEAAEQALTNVRDVIELGTKARVSYEKLAEKNVQVASEQLKKAPVVKKAA